MNTEEIIREELRMGSGFVNGRIRIYEAIRDRPKKEIPKFLAKEYGIGGWNANGRWCEHNGKGITIQDKGFVDIVSMAWDEVAERLIRLIDNDDYLTEKEKVAERLIRLIDNDDYLTEKEKSKGRVAEERDARRTVLDVLR